jgi:hypothetical protein
MRVSQLRTMLADLEEQHGDLECVVYGEEGLESVTRPKKYKLQDFDFGKLEGLKTGDPVLILWAEH